MQVQRVVNVLTSPDEVFRDLADEEPNLLFAYGILIAQALVTNVLTGWLILSSDSPQLVRSREAIEDLGVPASSLLVMLAVLAPFAALVNWGLTWIVVRLGAGTSERLWETAAWTQVPNLVMVPLAVAVGMIDTTLGSVASVVAILWCARLVQSGVRELSQGQGTRSAIVYAAIWLAYSIFALGLSQGGPPSGGGMIG